MNRYIAGSLLAALVFILGPGVSNMVPVFSGTRAFDANQDEELSVVGTIPIEQAGRVVRRQNPTAVAVPNTAFDQPGTTTGGTTLAPQNVPDNVIPRSGAVPPATTTTGDISPIEPNLVQPGTGGRPGSDQDLESIPALW